MIDYRSGALFYARDLHNGFLKFVNATSTTAGGNDIIQASGEIKVCVRVIYRPVTSRIKGATFKLLPEYLFIADRVLVQILQHGRERRSEHQTSGLLGRTNLLSVVIHNPRIDPWKGAHHGIILKLQYSWHSGNQAAPGFGLSPDLGDG